MQSKQRKNDSIQVSIRMRPLLLPYEDECAWGVNESTNTISTLKYLLIHI